AATAARAVDARADFELLRAAMERGELTGKTPVGPEFFGPLWPDGEPEGWPEPDAVPHDSSDERRQNEVAPVVGGEHEDADIALRIPVLPVEDTAENREELKKHLRRLVFTLNDLHVAKGGSGLKIAELQIRGPVPARQPVSGGES
ncbi:MAG: hypothetical protein AAGB51_12965, partial [Planctomycetota bacterium]